MGGSEKSGVHVQWVEIPEGIEISRPQEPREYITQYV